MTEPDLRRPPGTAGAALPDPGPDALAHSERLVAALGAEIRTKGGWIGFDRYMQRALYEPGLGYYAAKPAKIGVQGDFVTAPEISPLFARALAAQVAQAFSWLPPRLLEFGAGSGALAQDLMLELARLGCELESYRIVEVSPDLRSAQKARLRDRRVQWLDAPPHDFEGVIIANEVLDVMPVKLFVKRGGRILERGVSLDRSALQLVERPACAELAEAVALIEADLGTLPDGYGSEVGLVARAWSATLGQWLRRGLALLIDYGFPRHEYYHPQRAMGTVMCHYRHRAHADPLWLPGLNDITAHVDFSAIAEAAGSAGLQVLGYTSQARFLINCGLLELLREPASAARAAEAMRLLSEAEMGELLKVLAVGRDVPGALRGFREGDRSHRLQDPT
jgi:SAM-dependent MidA family methyltransferase